MEILRNHPDWNLAYQVSETLKSHGFKAHLAGGAVRDALIGRTPKDLDIVTDAKPEQVETLFKKTLAVGRQFGLIIVVENDSHIDVATYRIDGPYLDGRHPEHVQFSTIEEDAQRRDFTINALYMDLHDFSVLDFVGGVTDLKRKIIRAVGDPSLRFQEDKLRMLRALRFHSELGFELDASLPPAILKMSTMLKQVSRERCHDEVKKLLMGQNAESAINQVFQLNLGEDLFGFSTAPQLHLSTQLHTLKWPLALCWLFYEHQKTALERLKKLKFSNDTQMCVESVYKKSNLQPIKKQAEIYKLAANPHAALIVEWLEAIGSNKSNTFLELKKLVLGHYKLPAGWLNGQDLIQIGVPPGPLMGQLLSELYDEQLCGNVSNRDTAIEWVKKKLKTPV